jgi:hypothetical protein
LSLLFCLSGLGYGKGAAWVPTAFRAKTSTITVVVSGKI